MSCDTSVPIFQHSVAHNTSSYEAEWNFPLQPNATLSQYENETDDDMFHFNDSFAEFGPMPTQLVLYRQMHAVVNKIILPIIFGFGIVGNVLNLAVLGQRRFRRGFDGIEKSAILGMLTMGMSDLCFCLVGFASVFFPRVKYPHTSDALSVAGFYYGVYRSALLNVFLFCSTWLVVYISLERYLAICHPFHARWIIKVRRSVLVYIGVVLCSFVLNMPLFLKYKVQLDPCYTNCTCYSLHLTSLWKEDTMFVDIHKVVWAVLGTFLPFVSLLYCSTRILRIIHNSRDAAATTVVSAGSAQQKATNRITISLVAMVVLFLILVCPSMMITCLGDYLIVDNPDVAVETVYTYQIVVLFTNIMQAIRFSTNFLLYCVTNSHFREWVGSTMCKMTTRSSSPANSQRYQIVNVHI